MVVRLACALDVPLRERNELLLAAGYAPLYSCASLTSPLMDRVERALTSIMAQHEPFPSVMPALLDRAHREAVGGVLDTATAELVRGLRARPDVAGLLSEPDLSPGTAPVIDIHF
jgi:hypothetical protein